MVVVLMMVMVGMVVGGGGCGDDVEGADGNVGSVDISRKPLNDTTAKVCPSTSGGVAIMVVVLMLGWWLCGQC